MDAPRHIATLGYEPAMHWPEARRLTGRDFMLQLPGVGGDRPDDAEELIIAALNAIGMPKHAQRAIVDDLLAANRTRGG